MTKYLKLFALICLVTAALSACAPCEKKSCSKKHKTETISTHMSSTTGEQKP